jgi:hypothetical protein
VQDLLRKCCFCLPRMSSFVSVTDCPRQVGHKLNMKWVATRFCFIGPSHFSQSVFHNEYMNINEVGIIVGLARHAFTIENRWSFPSTEVHRMSSGSMKKVVGYICQQIWRPLKFFFHRFPAHIEKRTFPTTPFTMRSVEKTVVHHFSKQITINVHRYYLKWQNELFMLYITCSTGCNESTS